MRRRIPKTYKVREGDDWFTIAERILGKKRLVGKLIRANPGFKKLHKGNIIHMPGATEGKKPSSLSRFERLRISPREDIFAGADYEVDKPKKAAGGYTAEQKDRLAGAIAKFLVKGGYSQRAEKDREDTGVLPAVEQSRGPGMLAARTEQEGTPPPPESQFADIERDLGTYISASLSDVGKITRYADIETSEAMKKVVEELYKEYNDNLKELRGITEIPAGKEQDDRLAAVRNQVTDLIEKSGGIGGKLEQQLSGAIPTPTPTLPPTSAYSSDPNSLFMQLHEGPYEHPSSLNGFPFVSRGEWGAADINPLSGEGIFNEDDKEDGYYVYQDPIEDIYNTIVIHDTAVIRDSYEVLLDENNTRPATVVEKVVQTQQHHQKAIELDGRYWADVGYHFIIAGDGTIFEGRDIRARGTHVKFLQDSEGKYIHGNTGSLGISLIGLLDEEGPTQKQMEALSGLMEYLLPTLPNIKCVAGHADINANDRNEGVDVAVGMSKQFDLTHGDCYGR